MMSEIVRTFNVAFSVYKKNFTALALLLFVSTLNGCDPGTLLYVHNGTGKIIHIEMESDLFELKEIQLTPDETVPLGGINVGFVEYDLKSFKKDFEIFNVYSKDGELISNIEDFQNKDLRKMQKGYLLKYTLNII